MNGKMKMRVTSLLLCLMLLLGMLPISALAEEECAHANAVYMQPSGEATCFEPAMGGYWFCEDCCQFFDADMQNAYWDENEVRNAVKISATGHNFTDDGVCLDCGVGVPTYSKVTSLEDINEEDMYIFVAEFEGEESKRYFVLGGLIDEPDELGNIWCGADVSNAIGVTPNEDGTITLINQPAVFGVTAAEFMFDVNPDQWNFTETGLTTVMPLLPNHCVYSFQSRSFEDTGFMGVPRYGNGEYGMWDGGAWVIDFYDKDNDTCVYEDEFGKQTHASQVADGHIGDNISNGNLLMYPANYSAVGGAMFTLRFRVYDSKYYFICGEDGFLEGVTQEVEYGPISTNDTQYAISLYRHDMPTVDTHTCEWSDWTPVADTDTHTRTCQDTTCGKTETESHGWDNGTETDAPECTETGTLTYACADCGATKTEDIAALDHDWSNWADDGANAAADTHSHTCNRNCGVAAESEPHSWGDWAPDGDTNHKKTCSACGGVRTATHNWGEGVVTDEPSEDKEGETTYTCTDCGKTKTEPIGKLPHEHSWSDWGQNDETTHIRSCRCNETQTENHNFDDGTVINWPTHLAEGEIHYTCTDCGYVKIDSQPALEEHEWSDWSDNGDGTHTHSCLCNESETLAHDWSNWAAQDDGSYKRECVDCGVAETMTLPEDKPVNVTPTTNAANSTLTNTDIELIDKVLTDEEQSQVAAGEEIKVYLQVEDISNEAPAEHVTEAAAAAGDDEIAMYLDINLFKQVGTAAETPVTETSGAVTITITIPEELINADASVTRTYRIIRVHEDASGNLLTDVIEGIFNEEDNTFTFETDKFSTYALAYADRNVDDTPDAPATGDGSDVLLWLAILLIGGAFTSLTAVSKKQRNV